MNYVKTALLLAALTALLTGFGYMIGGAGGAGIAFVVALAINGYAFWNSGSMALRAHGAQPAPASRYPELHAITRALAQQAGLPMPGVYVIPSQVPNAFATGRNPQNGAVAVTTGLMAILDRDELAAVIAHELAHIRNHDTLIMTIAATLGGAIAMLANFALFFGGGRGRGAMGIIGVLLAAILAPMAAMMIQMMISRTREYAADKAAAQISGQPLALANALRKLGAAAGRVEMPSAERNPASAHLFIVNPLSGQRMDNLFSTHPAPQNRIAALEALARQMPQRTGATGGVPRGSSGVPRVSRRPGRDSGPGSRPGKGPWG